MKKLSKKKLRDSYGWDYAGGFLPPEIRKVADENVGRWVQETVKHLTQDDSVRKPPIFKVEDKLMLSEAFPPKKEKPWKNFWITAEGKKLLEGKLSYPMFSAALQDIEEFQQNQLKLGIKMEPVTGSTNPLIFGNNLIESYLTVLASIFNDKDRLIEDFVYGEDFGHNSGKTIQQLYNELINK